MFSDTPQGAAEQWIFDLAPKQWDLGVRAVTGSSNTTGFDYEDTMTPAVTVQYINGERYEGTESMPLGFRGQTKAPKSLATDIVDETVAANRDSSTMENEGNFGRGGYKIAIVEEPGSPVTLNFLDMRSGNGVPAAGETPRTFKTWEEAWAYVHDSGYAPNAEGARAQSWRGQRHHSQDA